MSVIPTSPPPVNPMPDQCSMLRSQLKAAMDFYDNSMMQEAADQIKARNVDPQGYPKDASPWPVASVQGRINFLNQLTPSTPQIVAALGAYYAVMADLYNMATARAEIDAANAGLTANNC